jgi:hypothetical protein
MSVRAYLNLKLALENGAKVEMKDTSHGYVILPNHAPVFHISGSVSEGPWIDLGEIPLVKIPEGIDPKLIIGFSGYDNVSTARRRMGEYSLRTARCIPNRHEGKYSYHLKLTATKLEDLQELHRLFCEGRIWPVVDYEDEMVPPPARHLRQLVAEAWTIIRRDMNQRFRAKA